jgi:hypothetical protein
MSMAGESWKSHKNTALERDMSADHDAQMDQWLDDEQVGPGPAEVARSNVADPDTEEIVQEIRDGYARKLDVPNTPQRCQRLVSLPSAVMSAGGQRR